MKKVFQFIVLGLLLSYSQGKKSADTSDGAPCPSDGEIGCIECTCEATEGFNDCVPTECPEPVKSKGEIPTKDKAGKCPNGPKFKAECTLCECGGSPTEGDHCALCFALPIRRPGQPDDVNKALPWLQDNRFFNYEVKGWAKRKESEML